MFGLHRFKGKFVWRDSMLEYRLDCERSKKAHQRLIATYKMEEADLVPVVEYTNHSLGYSIKELALDEEKMMRQQLENITQTSWYDTDYVPFLEPWICVPLYVEPFGAEVQFFENEWPACKPLVYDNPQDVYKLKYVKPWQSDLWKQLLKTIRFFEQNSRGDIPISTTDPQGPFTNASLLWQTSEFFSACYTDPKEVHYLMNLLTQQFIEFYEAQLKVIDNPAFPGHSFPLGEKGRGISISDDNSVMISPGLFEEFNLPYLSRISEHFNGLYYHSCGKYEHMLDSILKIPKLRAINWHTGPYEMNSAGVRKVSGRCAIWTGPSLSETGWNGDMPAIEKVFEDYYVKENMICGGKGVILSGYGSYYGSKGVVARQQNERIAFIRSLIKRYQ